MKITILEQFKQAKTGIEEDNGDDYFYNEDFVVLIDSVTSKSELWKSKQVGALTSKLIFSVMQNTPKEAGIEQLLKNMEENFKQFYIENKIFNTVAKYPYDRISSTAIIYSRYYNEVWMIGDCQCLVDGVLYKNELALDKLTSEFRSVFLEIELMAGKTVQELEERDMGRELILPILKREAYYANHPTSKYGFSVIDGFQVNMNLVKKIKVPEKRTTIVFTSDGYPVVKDTLKETESELTRILAEDPLCFRINKSTKGLNKNFVSFDDRSYLKFVVE